MKDLARQLDLDAQALLDVSRGDHEEYVDNQMPRTPRHVAAVALASVSGVAALLYLLPGIALADNCSGLSDCWSTAAGAASAAVGAAVGAIGGLFGGTGGSPEGEYGPPLPPEEHGPPVPEPPTVGPEGSGSDIEQKAGSDIEDLSDNMRDTFDDIVRVWDENDAGTPVITSGNDSKHGTNSLHYDNDAIDLRGKNVSDEKQDQLADDLQDALGDDYDVISEKYPNNPNNDHIHVEYDPD
ncbi:MAG: hypothetical protein ACRDGV_01055 [Candidatus Limnocylindria bacterium]